MTETTEWAFPERLQPRQEKLRFNLDAALQTVVQVHSEVPDEAFTASSGTSECSCTTVWSAASRVKRNFSCRG